MKRLTLLALAIVCSGAFAQQGGMPADAPKGMKPYTFCMLVKGPKWRPLTNAEEQRLMGPHLAYIRGLLESHKLLVAGPCLSEGPSQGIGVFATASLAEARALLANEPEIKAGRLAARLQTVLLPDLSGVKLEFTRKKP